jgi:hypothetical protein
MHHSAWFVIAMPYAIWVLRQSLAQAEVAAKGLLKGGIRHLGLI